MSPVFIFASVGIIVAIGFGILRHLLFRQAERALLTTKPNGEETPTDAGLDYEPLVIPIDERRLQAWLVRPAPARDAQKAILIFHGRYESISEWVPVQHYFWKHGIASMVFDYSGFGDSTGPASVANLRQDVQAAYQVFQSKTVPDCRKYLLGYSLGTGFLLEGIATFTGSFDGVILVSAYSSARDAAVQTGTLPGWLAFILPDLYNNVRMVQRMHKPLLIIHSRDDQVFPITMAEKIYAAANQPKYLSVLKGLNHNDTLEGQAAKCLSPVIEFLGLPGEPSEASQV
jgi:hypothetical protein